MNKISIEDLDRIKNQVHSKWSPDKPDGVPRITVHMGTCGLAAGAGPVHKALELALAEADIENTIVMTTGCAGMCSREPMVTVEIPGTPAVKYCDIDAKKIRDIVESHIIEKKPVVEYALALGHEQTY
jgi:NADP-reducing hydrogenase subunit HndB